jgi:hypothetical protein
MPFPLCWRRGRTFHARLFIGTSALQWTLACKFFMICSAWKSSIFVGSPMLWTRIRRPKEWLYHMQFFRYYRAFVLLVSIVSSLEMNHGYFCTIPVIRYGCPHCPGDPQPCHEEKSTCLSKETISKNCLVDNHFHHVPYVTLYSVRRLDAQGGWCYTSVGPHKLTNCGMTKAFVSPKIQTSPRSYIASGSGTECEENERNQELDGFYKKGLWDSQGQMQWHRTIPSVYTREFLT